MISRFFLNITIFYKNILHVPLLVLPGNSHRRRSYTENHLCSTPPSHVHTALYSSLPSGVVRRSSRRSTTTPFDSLGEAREDETEAKVEDRLVVVRAAALAVLKGALHMMHFRAPFALR